MAPAVAKTQIRISVANPKRNRGLVGGPRTLKIRLDNYDVSTNSHRKKPSSHKPNGRPSPWTLIIWRDLLLLFPDEAHTTKKKRSPTLESQVSTKTGNPLFHSITHFPNLQKSDPNHSKYVLPIYSLPPRSPVISPLPTPHQR
jgi:hypothetical protein